MKLVIEKNSKALGKAGAKVIAEKLNKAIAKKGYARIILSTGASQFDTIEALVQEKVDWSKVTMFHLDEYVNLPETHPASFRKYLKERFVSRVPLGRAFFVNGEGDVEKNLKELSEKLCEEPIDVGVIGIGENGHIAFNDPPADFDTKESYKIVTLDDKCKAQQVGEGWFPDADAIPKHAITMTPYRIMQCECIVSCVPDSRKADAINRTLSSEKTTNMIPATLMKEHKDFYLFLDEDSASMCSKKLLSQYL